MDKQSLAQQPYLTFFQDDTAEYDVIVDQSSSAPNLKEATWGAIQPLLPIIGEGLGPDEMALILEYSPMPESFLEKFKAIQEQKAQQPPPPDPEMMKVEAMKQAKAAELQMKQQEAALQIQIEQQKAEAQIALEKRKADAQFELDKMKLMFDAERMKHEMNIKTVSSRHAMMLKSQQSKAQIEASGEEASESKENDSASAEAITQMGLAIMHLAQSTTEEIANLGTSIKDAMTKPKTIVRGPDGRAVGVK